MERNVTLVGAGLVGSLLSIYLSKKGYKVEVFERRPDMRITTGYQGRSINLALSDRGWKALNEVGVADEIKKIAIPMHGRMMHGVDGTLNYQPYGKEGQAIYSVSRAAINESLMEIAEKNENVKFHFDERAESIDFPNKTLRFVNNITNERTESKADIIVGSDGAFFLVS
jgi:kynurenine 3-monooxygenase